MTTAGLRSRGGRTHATTPRGPREARPGTASDPESLPRPATSRRSIARTVVVPAALLATDVLAFGGAVYLTAAPTLKTLLLLLLLLMLFQAGDLYRLRLSLLILDDAASIMGRALAGGAAAMVVGGLDDGVAGTARLRTSALFGLLAIVGRAGVYACIRHARRLGKLQQRSLLLGAGAVSGTLATNMLAHPDYGLQPEGMLDDDPLLGPEERPVRLLGRYADLTDVLVEHAIDVVIVTYGSIRDPSVVDMIRACDRLACEIYFVPRLYELHAVSRDTEVLWGVPLLRLRRAPFRTRAWASKRVADVAFSSVALALLAPVLLACAVACRLETGCVLFRQTRIGLDGQAFTLLKFCSLRPAAEAESVTRWNIAEDDRVGRVGRLLRRTSLDELPQLWNVLRGDMSLVGPRPERPYFVDEFTRQFPWYTARHRVPAGLTGWAQIHGLRGDTSIADRARFDNFYIENWSMWGDIKILLRTFTQVVKAAGR
jgi:exopolysaccharide biosynthesis polyprenyl glycosylphosphotransferase